MKHVLLILLASVLVAQDKGEKELDDHDRDEERYERDFDDFVDGGKRSDRMEMMMVWRLTDDLELTTEQAEKFFPRFRKHREAMDETRKKERALGKELKKKLKKEENISVDDVKETVKKITELKKSSLDLESEFLLGMDDLLSTRQLANLGLFKHKMMKDVRGELKERKKNHRGMKKNMKRRKGGRRGRHGNF
jgi:hypothetical protein